MTQGMTGDRGLQGLSVVLARFEEQSVLAMEVERLADGRVVLFVPGAPDPWQGSVVLVDPQRVQALPVKLADLNRTLKGLGRGSAALLRTAA